MKFATTVLAALISWVSVAGAAETTDVWETSGYYHANHNPPRVYTDESHYYDCTIVPEVKKQLESLKPDQLVRFSGRGQTTGKMEIVTANPLTATEYTIIEMTNQERTRRGLKPLRIDFALMDSARQHANWMAATHRMQHTTKPVGENIAMGQNTCISVMNTWMNSSGHRANILGGWNRVGTAAYTSPSGRIYWCLQFLR
jgi:uncharacterized protein YkwD